MYSLNSTGGFRISQGDGTWITKTISNGLVNNDIYKWTIDEANGAIYLIHYELISEAYKLSFSISYDNGTTWTQVNGFSQAVFSVSGTTTAGGIRAFDVYNGTIVIQFGDTGLMVSKNAGTSWQRIDNLSPLTGVSAVLAQTAKIAKNGQIYAIFSYLDSPAVFTPNGNTYTTTYLSKNSNDGWSGAFLNASGQTYSNNIAILDGAALGGKNIVAFVGNSGFVGYTENDLNLVRLRAPTSINGYLTSGYYAVQFVDGYLYTGGLLSGGKGFVSRYDSRALYTHESLNANPSSITHYYSDNTNTQLIGPVNYIKKAGSMVYVGVQRGIIGSSPTTYGYYRITELVGGYVARVVDSAAGSTSAAWLNFSNIAIYQPTNSAPTNITLSPSAIAENSPAGSTVGSFSAVDAEGGAMVYSLVAGDGATDNSSFVIEGNALKTAAGVSLDYENKSSYSIRVKATDSGGLQFEKQLSVSVTDVNEVPSVISLSAQSISESAPVNSTIGVLSAVDPEGNAISYSVVSGGDKFNISGNALRNSVALDYEAATSHVITIRATDSLGATKDESFTISVTDILTDNLFTVPAVTASTLNFRAFASTTDPKTGMVKLSDGSSLPVGSIVRFNGKRHMKAAGGAEAFVEITNVARPEWGWSQEGEEAWETLDLLHI